MFGKPVTSLVDFSETHKANRFEMLVGVSLATRCFTRWLQFCNVIANSTLSICRKLQRESFSRSFEVLLDSSLFVYANAIPPQKSFLNRPQRIGREQPTMLGFDGLLTPVCSRRSIARL